MMSLEGDGAAPGAAGEIGWAMKRLSGMDAGFLYFESPKVHMHTLKVALVDFSAVPGGYSFSVVKKAFAERLALLPPFRRRIMAVPLGLNHPVSVEDPDFDLGRHLHRVVVAVPGGGRELCMLVSEIASHPLDRSRPLWEVWVAEGLADGTVGFVAKVHHAVADGVMLAALLVACLAPRETREVPPYPWSAEPIPSRRDLVARALHDLGHQLAGLPGLSARTTVAFSGMVRRRRAGELATPLLFRTPPTPFNRALSPRRSFAMTSFSLGEVRAVGRHFGTTVNDVVLAVCAGALRRELAERGALTKRPLVAGVPISAHQDLVAGMPGGHSGNLVSGAPTALRTDVAGPVERLLATREATTAAKAVHGAVGAQMLREWSEYFPPALLSAVMRLYSVSRLANRLRPPINVIVSNVAGPGAPLCAGAARLTAIVSGGPLVEGVGLNVTVWSYMDTMHVGVVACPDLLPNVWRLVDDLQAELGELRGAAGIDPAIAQSAHAPR